MTDSPANGTPGELPSPALADGEALDELRDLLLGPEQRQLRQLQARLDNLRLRPEDVSAVLPEAIHLRTQQDALLSMAIRGTVEEAMQASVRANPRILLDVLFPLIGPAIRKAIASALRSMLESFNQNLDVSISLRGVKWRLEALRAGKPFAEIVLLHTLHYRVEQVFLIHRETGLLLQHATAKTVTSQDGDLVSGMLTAIQSFIQDSFGMQGGEGLEIVQIGELTVWIEQGPLAIVAAVVRGNGPEGLRRVFQEAVEMVHLEQQDNLTNFRGDAKPFGASRPHLEACMLKQYKPHERRISPVFWLICAAILVGLGLWTWGAVRDHQRWTSYLESLRAEPGIVVTAAEKRGGMYVLVGLRDPLAADPQQLIEQAAIHPSRVRGHWEPYHALHPSFVLRRAEAVLMPPQTVRLSLDEGALWATGSAPHRWIVEARQLARVIPGVGNFRDDHLVDATLVELTGLTQQIEQSVLHFRKGAAQLIAGQEAEVQRLSARLQRLHTLAQTIPARVQLRIIGHTDTTGGEEKNLHLSQERADRVLSLLTAQGLATTGMSVWGMGSREPQVEEATDGDRELNRRVSFQVIIPGIANP